MKNLVLAGCIWMSALGLSYAQETATDVSARTSAATTDQLFLTNGEQHSVTVKKVEPTTITYSFAGEELENVVKKENVAKIIFKSGREQVFSGTPPVASESSVSRSDDYEYPAMEEAKGAILPFEFVFDGAPSLEEGILAQEYYYADVMKKPERNTISYQDPETTLRRLREAGIASPDDLRGYEMAEVARIVGAGVLVTGKIVVKYNKTTTRTSESTTVKVDEKKKKGKVYKSEYNTSTDEFNTRVTFKIYDKDGGLVMNKTRSPFLGTTRESYILTLSYLMKRTPYYQK